MRENDLPRTLRWAAIALLVLFAICSSAGAALARPAPFGARHDLTTSFAGASSVFSIDVDGDGDLDVFGAAYNADQVSWWENTAGDGSAWTERVIGTGVSGAYLVSGADIDGDGKLELGVGVEDYVYFWDTEGKAQAKNMWPTFQGSAQRTGTVPRGQTHFFYLPLLLLQRP